MTAACRHLLCEMAGSGCALAVTRSRGCTRTAAGPIAPEVFEEIAALVAVLESGAQGERAREAAARLAALIRREAIEDRHVLAQARTDEPELVPALERLCLRRA